MLTFVYLSSSLLKYNFPICSQFLGHSRITCYKHSLIFCPPYTITSALNLFLKQIFINIKIVINFFYPAHNLSLLSFHAPTSLLFFHSQNISPFLISDSLSSNHIIIPPPPSSSLQPNPPLHFTIMFPSYHLTLNYKYSESYRPKHL